MFEGSVGVFLERYFHSGKRKIIFKIDFFHKYVSSQEGTLSTNFFVGPSIMAYEGFGNNTW